MDFREVDRYKPIASDFGPCLVEGLPDLSTLWKFVVTSGCCHLPNSDGCGSILNLLIYRYCLDSNEINSKNLNVIQPYVGKNSPFIKSSNLFSFFNSSQIKS